MILEVQNLSCGYKKKAIIHNVSFNLYKGETLCLFGPNGVGKTTFFKTLLGLIKAIEGKVLLDGEDLFKMPRQSIAKNIAYVPQAHQMAFSFKVIDVVVMGRIAHLDGNVRPGNKDYEKAWAALDRLNVTHLGNRLYTQISGGERQMVLIARALTQDARILVMDEPTSNLDFGNQIKVMEQIHLLKKQQYATILTTHSPDQVLAYGDHVMVFHKGQKYLMGKPSEIITDQLLNKIYNIDIRQVLRSAQCFGSQFVPDYI